MSDQAENAATQQVIDAFRAANEAKAKLEGKLKALGNSLSAFSRTLQSPGNYFFDVNESSGITVGEPRSGQQRPTSHVSPAEINWEDLCGTLRNYMQAREDREQGASRLAAMGIPVKD